MYRIQTDGVQLEVGLKVIRGQTYKSPNLRPGVGFVNWVIYTSVPESHFQLHPAAQGSRGAANWNRVYRSDPDGESGARSRQL